MQQILNHLHLGDCISLMQSMPADSIDLALTDPPYLVRYRDRLGRSLAGDVRGDWLEPAFAALYRLMRQHRFVISFYGWQRADQFISAWRKAGFSIIGHFVFAKHYASRMGFTEARHECAYLLAKGQPDKPANPMPDVLPWGKYTGNRHHPTQKPLEILRRLIKTYSRIGDVVLDPFAGSGSTLIAAAQLERSWIGIEIDPAYHKNAVKRLTRNISKQG